ncbi:MAG: DUF1080 domain-containing protein [Candidatus Poribacteria bacterium]|nr:DUF1080 domain-containing protein [Candidatus Poribacteria bacterium]
MTIELMLLLLAISVQAGTLRDNFDDGNFDGWEWTKVGNRLDKWSVENGELVIVSKNLCASSGARLIGDETWENYEFACQFKLVKVFPADCADAVDEAPSFGIGVHANNENRFDKLRFIDLNAESIGGAPWKVRCRGFLGAPQFFHQEEFAIQEDKWYAVRIVANEGDYEMFIDERRFCDFQTPFPDKGGALLWGHNVEAHFDNVVITGDDIPDRDLGLPVEPKAKLATTWATIKQGARLVNRAFP